jgi:hypothetical protein
MYESTIGLLGHTPTTAGEGFAFRIIGSTRRKWDSADRALTEGTEVCVVVESLHTLVLGGEPEYEIEAGSVCQR